MSWDEDAQAFTYSCPCGDLFQISLVRAASSAAAGVELTCSRVQDDLRRGEEIAHCPSCTLFIKVVYNQEDFAADLQQEPDAQPDTRPPPVAVA